MQRVIASESVPFANRDVAPTTGTPQYFTDGNPITPIPPTLLPGYFMNMLMDELIAILTAAGIEPDDTNWAQVVAGIRALIAVETTRAEGIEATLATIVALNAETTRAEGVENNLAAEIATKAPIAGNPAQTFAVAPAQASDQAVQFGQLVGSGALANQTESGLEGGSNISTSVTFTAGGAGWMVAIGSRNNSGADAAGNFGQLFLNGAQISSDHTELSMTHFGAVFLNAAQQITATYIASAAVAFSVNVVLIFIPSI
jgi:hypothetical protein